jgi:rhodanese-related sulfurtransferase
MRSVEDLLAEAQVGLSRMTASEVHAAATDGALLVDIRSVDQQREQGGRIPSAADHPLGVVLWRLDPLPRDTKVIVICGQGYSSSLVARDLQWLGFRDATDVIDGFEGWLAAGLPVERPPGVRRTG